MHSSLGPDIPIGCGLHNNRLDSLYRTGYPLFAYLKPWGGEIVVVIQDGHILGLVQRDKRPVWQKLRERLHLYYRNRFPKKEANSQQPTDDPLAGCAA